jgi:uncharacterized surface protein with fasciclin (FAS1) repeats
MYRFNAILILSSLFLSMDVSQSQNEWSEVAMPNKPMSPLVFIDDRDSPQATYRNPITASSNGNTKINVLSSPPRTHGEISDLFYENSISDAPSFLPSTVPASFDVFVDATKGNRKRRGMMLTSKLCRRYSTKGKGGRKNSKKSRQNSFAPIRSPSAKRLQPRRNGSRNDDNIPRGKNNDRRCSGFVFDDLNRPKSRRHMNIGKGKKLNNILEIARTIPRLSIFVDLIERADLEYVLECSGPFTFIPPNNKAFLELDPTLFARLLLRENQYQLKEILLNHLFPGVQLSFDFVAGLKETLSGKNVLVNVNPLTFNSNAVAGAVNIMGSNGAVHIINKVLLSESMTIYFA